MIMYNAGRNTPDAEGKMYYGVKDETLARQSSRPQGVGKMSTSTHWRM